MKGCHCTFVSISTLGDCSRSSAILSRVSRLYFRNAITSVMVSALAVPNTALGSR